MTTFDIGFIGFGEAAGAFVDGWRETGIQLRICAYDKLFDTESSKAAKEADCHAASVTCRYSAREVARESDVLISAVTADQVGHAARSVGALDRALLYLDINSASPEKKKAAAETIGAAYVDVAVLSPVHPHRHESPMLLAGALAKLNGPLLASHFPNAEIISDAVGDASLVKMIRSVFVKGLESVAMECALAAYRSGLADRIFPSLDPVLRHADTKALTDYTMERVASHGVRRAAEMEEVCDTLHDLGLPSAMSRASAQTQRLIGNLRLAGDGALAPDAEQIARAILRSISE